MTNTYRALSEIGQHYWGDGDHDLTTAEESDALSSGHLELVPRPYRVLSRNYQAGKQGEVVTLALLREHEQALIQGGHLQRVERPAPKSGGKKPAE